MNEGAASEVTGGDAALGVRFEERAPSLDEYRAVCTGVGWDGVMNFDAAPRSLARSLHHVVAVADDQVVGMGRLVGDGAIYVYVQDLAVVPSYQGRGLGDAILARLLEWVSVHVPDRAFVGLFAAAGSEGFYRRHGFERYDGLVGMFQVTPLGRPPGTG